MFTSGLIGNAEKTLSHVQKTAYKGNGKSLFVFIKIKCQLSISLYQGFC